MNKIFKAINVCIVFSLFSTGAAVAANADTDSNSQIELAENQKADRTIKGVILDESNDPLIGVSVVLKGSTTGVLTDLDGKFTLKAKDGDVIVISYLGFLTQEFTVNKDVDKNFVLKEDNIVLGDVVVTALGIRRESKALTYNVQQVTADDITAVRDANFINGLAGKVAGVTINESSSGVGGGSRVVIRGEKSISGDNNALYVIDGVPIMNAKNSLSANLYESNDGGDSDPMSLLNPNDIESISVLTGASSAALYGSRGANGVIMITTKKGEAGKTRVSYTNDTQFSNPLLLPKFQNTYGSSGAYESWGRKLETPSSYNPKDFFQTGFNEVNSLSVSAGGERSQTMASLASTIARGIIHNNNLNRLNFTARNTTELIKNKLRMDIGLTYSTQKTRDVAGQGLYHNPLVPLYLFPRGDDFNAVKVYQRTDVERNLDSQFWTYGNQGMAMQNPYWIVNKERFQNKTDRYSLNVGLNYDVLDWLNVMGRVRMDHINKKFERKISATSDGLFASEAGNYMQRKSMYKQVYADLLVNLNKRFGEDYTLSGTLGASILDTRNEITGFEGHLNLVPNLFTYHNIDMSSPHSELIQEENKGQTQSLFATAQFGYKSMLYLDVTARGDWDSALAFTKKQSLFYPSVGLSGIITEMVALPQSWATYLKVRGSYSEVGNAPSPYMTRVLYDISKGQPDLQPMMPVDNLKPERTKSLEVGLEYKALNGRLGFDFTYYNANTYNQLLPVEAGSSAMYDLFYINAGKINNWGIEAAVNYNQKFGNVSWNSHLTFTLNRNKIKELIPEGTIDPTTGQPMDTKSYVLPLNTEEGYKMELREGGTMSDIYVYTLKKDHQGFIQSDPNTGAIQADPQNWVKAGQAAPKFNLGWGNDFEYKGISLSFLFDARIGGVGVSATEAMLDKYGVSRRTAEARDNGGVTINGGRYDAEPYYKVIGGGRTGVLSEYVYSSTNIRLRQLRVGYSIPKKWLGGIVSNVNVAFVGKNLFFVYNKAPYDPEVTASTGTFYQGFDYFKQPSTRSLGFSVKVDL